MRALSGKIWGAAYTDREAVNWVGKAYLGKRKTSKTCHCRWWWCNARRRDFIPARLKMSPRLANYPKRGEWAV